MSGYSFATSVATASQRPSVYFMMLALWTAVTFWRPFSAGVLEGVAHDALGALHRDRLDRDPGVRRIVFSALGSSLMSSWMSSRASGVSFSNSMPA